MVQRLLRLPFFPLKTIRPVRNLTAFPRFISTLLQAIRDPSPLARAAAAQALPARPQQTSFQALLTAAGDARLALWGSLLTGLTVRANQNLPVPKKKNGGKP